MRNNTFRLATSYLAIIMTMSVIFSGLIYSITASKLGHPLGDGDNKGGFHEAPSAAIQQQLQDRDAQTRYEIVISLLLLNLGVLVFGAWLSYFLARRTLAPIEKAMEIQTRFVSDASHELRTPLTVLQTSNEVALRKKHLTEQKMRSVLESNILEIVKLRELSNALLELTQSEQKERKTQSVNLDELIRETVKDLQVIAEKKKITIQSEATELKVNMNRKAVKQILSILLDNAIKYSPESKTVAIKASRDDKGTTLYVQDEGIGIAKDDIDHIFDRFYRAEDARTRTENSGYGLGLSIAKSISNHQGYTLNITSEFGVGSTFSIRIPH